ncbi:hypothetical protein [Cohnella sp. GbtcB17]|uniref:hypothetical protein n=1 Tax=Cohnella sp. GbtcB17 TaxID=2824762 RepID=UPI001C308765|nr:hypothetical protein [Cohnella sp. GbtcB17]
MSVQIIITGVDAAEALTELSSLSGGFAAKPVVAAPTAEMPKTERAPRTTRTKTEQPKEEAQPADTQEAEIGEKIDISDEDIDGLGGGDAAADTPVPSDVELRALASTVGAKGPDAKKAIKALLDKYGVPNITAVPANKRIAFKAELEQL